MLCNYLLIAWRNLIRHKAFSLINILGLAVGMAACLLIWQYVSFELSYDQFHQNASRIYRVTLSTFKDGKFDVAVPKNFSAAGPTLKQDFPEVRDFARLWPIEGTIALIKEEVVFNERKIYFADPSFLSIFTFRMVQGMAAGALNEPNTGVISASAAKRYFGSETPIGKTIIAKEGNRTLPFTIKAVFEDIPENSHLDIDFLFSHATLPQLMGEQRANHDWGSATFYTYLLLRPDAIPAQLMDKFPAFIQKYVHWPHTALSFHLQPLREIYLYSDMVQEIKVNGSGTSVYLMGSIAVFILLIAWINYVNLTTARVMDRAKEIGVRKVAGANRRQLVKQFILESLLINLIAVIIGLTLVQWLLPYFTALTGKPLVGLNGENWLLVLGFFLAGSIGSALYPALILSAFQPIQVLKGKVYARGKGQLLRKSLVVFQFAASVTLIAGTFAVYRQLSFMSRQDLGMNINQLLVLPNPDVVDTTFDSKALFFQAELRKHAAFPYVVSSSSIPAKPDNIIHGGLRRAGSPALEGLSFYNFGIDSHFAEAYDLQLLAGRNFSRELDTKYEVALINEEAARKLGFAQPQEAVGQEITSNSWELITVVGVVKNFHQQSLKSGYEPTVLYLEPLADFGYYTIKIQAKKGTQADLNQLIALIEKAWNQAFPGNPFEYFFLDEYFDAQYKTDRRFGEIFGLFAALAIFVACLGLFGLASFATTQRTKEIGIRKVLGASIPHILTLLSTDFIKLVLLANLVAWPLAYWGIHHWLRNYAFRIDVSWGMLAMPGLLVLLIALLTVTFHTWKAAGQNPVKALRYE